MEYDVGYDYLLICVIGKTREDERGECSFSQPQHTCM